MPRPRAAMSEAQHQQDYREYEYEAQSIDRYMFKMQQHNGYILEVTYDKLIRIFEALFTIFIFISMYILNKLFFNKYQFIVLILLIFFCVNLVIRILFSYVSMGDEITVIHKAGITSRISYIRSSDIVSLEVESNFLQRRFNYVNLYLHYISCNDEQSIKLRNFKKEEVDRLIGIWR